MKTTKRIEKSAAYGKAGAKRNARQQHRASSVQKTFCPIQEVEHESFCLEVAGKYEWLAVLEVQGLTYSLRSEEEQYGLNEQFQQLLVALPHPLQILLRIVPIDLEHYLSFFALTPEQDAVARGNHNPALMQWQESWIRLAASHVQFMQKRAASHALLERRFYLIVPALADSIQERSETAFARLFHHGHGGLSREAQKTHAQHQMLIRCQELERQLNAMSLSVHRLSNQQLIEFEYACLRPKEARTYPLLSSWIERVDRLVTMDGSPHNVSTKHFHIGNAEQKHMNHPSALQAIPHSVATHQIEKDEGQAPKSRRMPHRRVTSGQWIKKQAATSSEETDTEAVIRWPMVADLIAPACIQTFPECLKIEQEYVQVLDVHTLPRRVAPGWFRQLMRIDEVMDVSLFYIPQPSAATMRALRRKRFEMHSTTLLDREHDRYPDPERVAAQEDVEGLMDRIASGHDRVLEFAMHVLVRGQTRHEMHTRTERIRAMLYSMQLGSRIAYFEQEKGVRSCLPYARHELRTNVYPLILGSHEASSTFPFLAHTLFEADGILEGVTRSGEPVVVNWWGKGRRNANRLIVGPSGSGKTFKIHVDIDRLFVRYGKALFEQQDQQQRRLPFQCIIVDIEREFRRHTLQRGGQWIRLAPGTQQCINPFDLPQTHRPYAQQSHQYVEYTLADKIADMQALLDVMLAEHDVQGRGRLSNQEKGLLDKVLYASYNRVGITDDPLTHSRIPPLLHDVYDVLTSGLCGPDPTGLGPRLQRFVEGSLSGLFSEHTNVALDAPLECFDIHDLPTDLRPIAIFLLSSHVWNISFGSAIPILFIVDELVSLFQYEEGRRFIEALFQRARKHNLSVIGVTQHLGILIDSSIPTNSATTIIMAQEAASLSLVQQIFHVSEAETQELRTFGKGEALLLMGEQRFSVRFEASESEYQVATSDPDDLAQFAQDQEAQGENKAKEEIAAKRKHLETVQPSAKQQEATL